MDIFFDNWKKNASLKHFFNVLEKTSLQLISKDNKIEPGKKLLRNLKYLNDSHYAEILNRNDIYFDLKLPKRSSKDEKLFLKSIDLFINGSRKLNKIKQNYVLFKKNIKIQNFPLDISKTIQKSNVDAFYFEDLNQSWNLFKDKERPYLNQSLLFEKFTHDLSFLKQHYQKLAKIFWSFLHKIFGPKNNDVSKSLFDADLWPRITPYVLLKYLNKTSICDNNAFSVQQIDSIILNDEFLYAIGAFFVVNVNIRQIERMSLFYENKDEHSLLKEFLNVPHSNWSPSKYPGWLIFEIEHNLTIREVQIKVAEKFMRPIKQKNTVLQLNMGEGKSAVIVPMLSIALADQKKLIRLIVLNSLFKINYNALVQKLGGVLNKRVYTFKCTRDMDFSRQKILRYKKILNECKSNKGLFITIPEHLLSFKLKCVEMSKFKNAIDLLNIWNWINKNVMDILDESDEILNVMYQCKLNKKNNFELY